MNKEESLDRLLERTSVARADACPQGVCLDAETLAAWTEGSLSARERADAETHAADCDRCLAVLAGIAKTSPPPSATRRPSWLSARWLVPLTTAAAAVTVWAVVQQPTAPPSPPPNPATNSQAEAVTATKPAEPPAPQQLPADSLRRADAQEKKAAPPAPARNREPAKSGNPAGTPALDALAAAPPPVATPKPAASAARQEVLDERAQAQFRAVGPGPLVVSPDPNVRWRLVGGSVERSTDGGVSWQPQPTGTTGDLLAGSSPARDVCWIVGRGGVVLLTTDGATWRRVTGPDPADLTSVTARDGRNATVTAANGRTYRTADGGLTWILQENPAAPF